QRASFSLLTFRSLCYHFPTSRLVKRVKIEQLRDALYKLFAESIDIPPQEILDELELQCDCLRDGIIDIRIPLHPGESDQKPTQNPTQRPNDQPALGDINPPRPVHSRH